MHLVEHRLLAINIADGIDHCAHAAASIAPILVLSLDLIEKAIGANQIMLWRAAAAPSL